MSSPVDKFIIGSPLAKRIGSIKPSIKVVSLGGRLEKKTFAVKWIPTSVRQKAIADALKVMLGEFGYDRSDLYTETGEAALELESRVHLLSQVLVDPENPAMLDAGSPAEVRALLDPDEISILYRYWMEIQLERSPLDHAKSTAEVDAIVDELGKSVRPTTYLQSCAYNMLLSIATSLVSRLITQTKQPSSDTGQQTELSNDSTQDS